MAAPTKKRVVENEENPSENVGQGDENNGSDDDVDMAEHVDVDFEAFSPTDADFHGIKALLQQVFLKANIDLAEITNTIITQNYIGNVLKMESPDSDQEESDDTVFAVGSVINISHKKHTLKSIETMTNFVAEKCGPDSKLSAILADEKQRVGWIICERFINIPPQAAVPMIESLVSDMKEAVIQKKPFTFDWLLKVCKCYKLKDAAQSEMFFTDAEDNILQKHAQESFTYSVAHEHDTVVTDASWEGGDDDSMEALRTVLLIERSKFDDALTEVKQQFSL